MNIRGLKLAPALLIILMIIHWKFCIGTLSLSATVLSIFSLSFFEIFILISKYSKDNIVIFFKITFTIIKLSIISSHNSLKIYIYI